MCRLLRRCCDDMVGGVRGILLLYRCCATGVPLGCRSGVGVSFSNDNADHNRGLLITLAIAFHNIPEGLGVAVVLVTRGVSPTRAALWAIFTSLPQVRAVYMLYRCHDDGGLRCDRALCRMPAVLRTSPCLCPHPGVYMP